MTPLDAAHLRAEETGAEADRLAFWSRLAEAELHLLIEAAPEGDAPVTPRIVEVEGVRYALAVDLPERLAALSDGPAPTATLAGRRLAVLLAEAGLGLGLNLPEAPSAQLLPAEALAWLAESVAVGPSEAEARIEEVGPPGALPDALLVALDAKLPALAGLATVAYLAHARFEGGARGHMLGVVGAVPGAEPDIARAVQEAMAFSGLEAGALDVAFLRASDPLAGPLARHGLRIDLPAPERPAPPGAAAPPRLR
ncbi:SseB family protein [Jannaschia sp. Os4]|uniref:SseB family protein n=1 Tax=Jannaschia sp. Os4 TaxID=2807617 RepID=UPI00193A793C|nr:SseB family protein [Jannaschia sp. Os4]MBM2576793.1 SseB family protein [Jannaschia sp. Os4]